MDVREMMVVKTMVQPIWSLRWRFVRWVVMEMEVGDGKKGVSGVEMGCADELLVGTWWRLREIWRCCLGWIEKWIGFCYVEEDDERE
ncbi:hypothetical protein MRB53_028668 [Persea americana]|uniref:Uncharacterized protein n=1 Tax=Persea americana TaxID=3435 RepID=A0ACC2KG91_PERAE|nr:hypothetical protein MRB53_028668 [Persea americana]